MHHRRTLPFVVLLAWLVAGAPRASATVLGVPSPYPSITAAFAAASDGDTVLVGAGTFHAGGYCGKGVTLMSRYGPEFTTLTGDPVNGSLWLSPPDYAYTRPFRLIGFSFRADSLSFEAIHSWYMDLEVINCVFLNTLGPSIVLYGRHLTVRGCRFYDETTSHAGNAIIEVKDWSGSLVLERSVFYELRQLAVRARGEVRITNNVFWNCPGAYYETWSEIGDSTLLANNVFAHLTFAASRDSRMYPWQLYEDYNLYYQNLWDVFDHAPGAHDLFIEPAIANVAAGDFSPLTGSPCIDAGHPDDGYNDPDGSRGDIGAVPFMCSLFDPACDTDSDGVANPQDNCPRLANAAQADTNQSGIGDDCECNCACHANPRCDDVYDIRDVTAAIRVILRGDALPNVPVCPQNGIQYYGRADVDCSGETDLYDLMGLIDVVFRAYPPASRFCNPCN